jgi:hypothetical protein
VGRAIRRPACRGLSLLNSKAASGTIQQAQDASGSNHGACIPTTVANPPVSRMMTAEHKSK